LYISNILFFSDFICCFGRNESRVGSLVAILFYKQSLLSRPFLNRLLFGGGPGFGLSGEGNVFWLFLE
jgi:hypothetical protein